MSEQVASGSIPTKLYSELLNIKDNSLSCTLVLAGDTHFSPYYNAGITYLDDQVIQFTCAEQTDSASTIQQYTYRIDLVDGVGTTLASIPSSYGDCCDEGDMDDEDGWTV